ncbi:hypothetical protein HS042_24525 [Serratia marcescens]|uniref:hypothetical protein n=1 Tax=Serratia marcescens TaxID=615 RepID=UPI0018C23F46|nr:hypothetical protein [Serratia marcescens]MBN5390758.1 hypothetical protein [Serratia marcescens]QPJ91278.1 hypothetical protein HS042_24525 [Serratia marcescens]
MGKSAVLDESKQHEGRGEHFTRLSKVRNYPIGVGFTSLKGSKKLLNGCLVLACLSGGEVRAQLPEVVSIDFRAISFSVPTVINEGIQYQEDFIGNGIELFAPIPALGKPMTEPSTQTERNNRPNEGNKGWVGIEKQNELTPEGVHKFKYFLLIQIGIFLSVFPLSVYFSMRQALRRDWAKHMPKGRAPKVSVLGVISILCITRRFKPRRWQMWEQRQWFRDMKACHGLVAAYRDVRHWKKSAIGESDA